jgi:hypothetical protein
MSRSAAFCVFRLGRRCGISTHSPACCTCTPTRPFWSLIEPPGHVLVLMQACLMVQHCSMEKPAAFFFSISNTILYSSATFPSVPAPYYSMTPLRYRTRQANHYCALWNYCCSCSCSYTSSSEPQLGSGPLSHELESGSSCIKMDTTMLSFYFIFYFLFTAYIITRHYV